MDYCIYSKIPKIIPWNCIVQRPFFRGLFLEGSIFGRAYLRREICRELYFSKTLFRGLFLEGSIFGRAYLWREICLSKSIGLALQLGVNLPFLLCFPQYLRALFQVQAPWGAYIWRGDLTEDFLRYRFGQEPIKFDGLLVWGTYNWRSLFSEFYGIT